MDERWRRCAESWGIGDLADVLAPHVTTCVRVVSTRPDAGLLGASRMGGAPDLPEGTPWPSIGRRELSFVAQFDLSEFEPGWVRDLPPEGRMWLFVDAAQTDGRLAHVLLFSECPAGGLRRAKLPKARWASRQPIFESSYCVAAGGGVDDDRLLLLPPESSAIGGSAPIWCDSGALEATLHRLGLGEIEPYVGWSEARFQEEIDRHREAWPEWAHGHARFLDETVRPKRRAWLEQRGAIEALAATSRTLLLVTSEPDLDWCWGDAGALEILIDSEDLRRRRFDRTYLRLCSS